MFDNISGRLARSLQEAEEYIIDFIVENHVHNERRVAEKSHDYDLYLPWLMEIVEYQKISPDLQCECPTIATLESLYMDAAWSLCNKGYLRPGPRHTNSDNPRDGYGKGYSLTLAGQERLCSRFRDAELDLAQHPVN